MADNNDLKVVVGLNLPKSVLEIKKDLVKLADELADSDDGKLKIVGQLDLGATEKNIKAQLSSLKIDSSALKITPTIDTSSASQLGNQITKQLDTATQKVDFSAIAKNLRKAFNINDNASIKEATENIKAMYEAFNVDPEKYKAAFNKLIGWYEQRSKDFVYTERQKVDELNNLMLELYNQPELHTKLPGLGKASKDNPLLVTKGTLEEMKSLLGSMQEVYKLFGSIRVDDKHGALIGSFGEDWDPKEYNDALAVYIQYLQKIQELRKASRFQPTDVMPQSEYESIIKLTEQSILEQLNLVNANNKVIQSNEKVAQSERDVTEAQKELNNAKKSVNTDKGNDEELKKLTRSTDLLMKMTKQYELIKYYQEQQRQSKAGTDEWEYYNKAWQEEKQRLDVTKQVAQAEGLVTEEYKKQTAEAMKRIDEKYAQLKNAKNIINTNGGNYLSNNQIQDMFASLNEAEKYFKNFNLGTVTSSLAKGQLQGLKDFVIELKSATGEVEKFRYAVENIGDDQNPQLVYKLTDIKAANAGIQRLTESTEKFKATLEAQATILKANADALKSQWEDSNGGKSVRNEEHVAKLTEKYNVLIATIEKLRSADSITATEIKGNIKAQETDIKSLISAYHNAEKVATSLRARDTETSIINTKNNIREFMSNLNASKVSFNAVENELQKLAQAMQALDGAASGDKAARLRDVLNAFENLQTKFKAENAIAKNFNDISKSVEKVITDLNAMSRTQIFTTHSNNAGVIEFQDKIKSLSDVAKQVKADLNALGDSKAIPPELKARIDNLTESFKKLEGSNKTLQANLRQNDGWARTERQIQTLTARIKEYMVVNTKAVSKYKSQFDGLFSGLSQAEMNKDSEAVRRLSADFQILQHTIKAAGDQGKTLGQTIVDNAKRFSSWMTLTGIISTGWRELRKMVSTVIELDTAMTNLKKVSDETATTYSNFLKSSIKQAQELHSSVSNLIEQTTTWKKLGFDLNQAQQLSRASMIYSNVGDVDNEQAVTNIVSAIKAFDIEVQDVMKIPDVYNRLGNEFAVSSKNLGSGMSKAASTLALMGSSFEEVAALLTGSGEILGDNRLEEIGNGLRVVTLRIMNQAGALHELNEEYEDLESVSKTQQQVYEYTRGQVNIMSDLDPNTFKKPYEILKEIAEIFDDLNQTEQSKLIQLLFGKNRADVGTSIIKAFQSGQIQKALEAAENSAGSAEKEFANFEKSIESHLNDLTAAFQGLSSVVVNSELIKGFVDAGTGALNLLTDIISRFGTLQTIIPVVFTSLSLFRNVGRAKVFALKNEYAHCNVVVTRNEFMQVA